MEPERWRKVDQLYHSALEIESSLRAAFIQKSCAGDEFLEQEVRSLLAQAEADKSFLEAPAVELMFSPAHQEGAGLTIGRYRVLRLLGDGGMGAVYEAEQGQPRRTVALKVIKPGFATAEALRRFQHESEALGRLQHPGIAQIYEASTADTGFGPQRYFAMELIRGLPMQEYAEQHKLTARDHLALMAKVCDAVDHAHQRGVIHRDLKPGNILVDETGQPKILDFGVARVTERDGQRTRQTDVGQLVGTLAYMSPEQVAGDPATLDLRSDVYALGVILYELLAGKLPYDISRKPLLAAVGVIREEEPAPLSSIDRHYRGDIDTIVAKALEKDKARRYGSAAELAGDIRRYLTDEPITARPASASYQLQKFARRHKALVAGTATVFVVLAAGVVASTWQAVRARTAEREAVQQRDRAADAERRATAQEESVRTERDRAVGAEERAQEERLAALAEKRRADAEAATSEAVNDFLQNDLLAQASAGNQATPSTKPDPELKVRTALDRAAARIEGKFKAKPEVEAAIRDTIGQTYMDVGLYAEARKQLETAFDLYRRLQGAEAPKTLQTMSRLGRNTLLQGKYPEAEALLSRAVDTQRRVLGPEHPDTLLSMSNLCRNYYVQGKLAQAEAICRQTLKIRRRVSGPEHPDTLNITTGLAAVYVDEGKFAESEALSKEALEIKRRVLGAEHPSTIDTMGNLGIVYYRQAKYAQVEALFSQILEIRRRALGAEHPSTLDAMNNLGSVYNAEGKYAQAAPLFGQALEVKRRTLGPEHPVTLDSMFNLAIDYIMSGEYQQAEALFGQCLEIQRRVLGPEHPRTLKSAINLADVYTSEGKYAQAEALFSKTLEAERRIMGPEDYETLFAMADMTFMYQRQGEYGLAETYAAQALAGRRHALGAEHADTMYSGTDLALAYLSQGKFAESEPIAREVVQIDRKTQPNEWFRFRAESVLGASLSGQKKYDEAEPLLLAGYRGMFERKERIGVPDRYHLDRAREWLVQLYEAWGKPEKAAEWKQH